MIDLDSLAATVRQPPVPKISDLRQDILALAVHQWRRDLYFVEFGALNGVRASNTWLLERDYGWTGIVAEPAQVFHDELQANRRCRIDMRAVAAETGRRLRFKETDTQLGLSGLMDYFKTGECHTKRRLASQGREYDVDTVSLTDLLAQHGAPPHINYISMDTEGSELSILETFDFSRYTVGLWTIEHNYFDADRSAIFDIMTRNGYERILTDLSTIDDWYIPRQ